MANLRRLAFVAAFLPIFWIYVLPNQVSAQLPRVDAIAGMNDTRSPQFGVLEERSEPTHFVFAEEPNSNPFVRLLCGGEWYFSWGASRESWGRTNIHVSQPTQGNYFTVYNVRGVDDPSWNSLFGGQYNIRIGRFVDEAQTLAVEVNFDHTKYTSVLGQTARVTGSVAGKPTDGNYVLSEPFFSYNLHNGANHLMFNLVKRVPLIGATDEPFSVAGIAKAGVGVMLPHPDNVIMGQYSNVGPRTLDNIIGIHRGWWQLDGWTTGIEAGFRVNLTKHLYLELTDKVAFAQLGDVSVYQGTARHNLWMNEIILSVGVAFGGGRQGHGQP